MCIFYFHENLHKSPQSLHIKQIKNDKKQVIFDKFFVIFYKKIALMKIFITLCA
jgi:hypothetical protein